MCARSRSLALVALLVCGCVPVDVPCFSPDGTRIAILVPSKHVRPTKTNKNPMDVGIVTLATGRFDAYPLPEGWSADGMLWVGSKLLVLGTPPRPPKIAVTEGENPWPRNWLLDPEAGARGERYVRTRVRALSLAPPFVGRFKGRGCIYVPHSDTKTVSQTTKVFALDCTTELGLLPYPVEDAGDGWLVATLSKKPEHTDWYEELVAVDVFNPEGRKVARITREEIGKA